MSVLRILTIPLIVIAVGPSAAIAAPRVAVLELRDTIQPASLRYIDRGLERAAEDGAALVLIELDTPGGLLVSLRSMTTAIVRSPVPVVVYVTPPGARAASAGFFLLLAADVAAMAPGTNTGAAHPVSLGQQPDDDGDEDPARSKATEDAAALARALAAGRNRSAELAEAAVRTSAAYSSEEALANGLVDLIAADRDALLRRLDGRTLTRFDGRSVTLTLQGADVVPIERTFAERLLTVIADPQVAYLLLMVGAILLFVELMNPGLFVAGIGGTLSLLLGLYGFSVLPVSVVGALLMLAGLGLLIAEAFFTSYGILAVAGVVSFVFGSLMLVDTPAPSLQIGPEVVLPVAVVLAALAAVLAYRAIRSRRLGSQAGVEAMIGEHGQVVDAITPEHDGKVFVHGEYWTATSPQALDAGEAVRVETVDGLRLHVVPSPPSPDHQGGYP